MQYSFKIGHALGALLNILNEQQRALMSASKVQGFRVQGLVQHPQLAALRSASKVQGVCMACHVARRVLGIARGIARVTPVTCHAK